MHYNTVTQSKAAKQFILLFFLFSLLGFYSCEKSDSLLDLGGSNNNNTESTTSDIEGSTGYTLKNAWTTKLKANHTRQSYTPGVWNAIKLNGVREDGYIDDIYGGPYTNYRPGTDQQSSGTSSGRYDREHSFPKSWWGSGSSDDGTDMYTDLFHLYPCDHDANSTRSNLPYGEITGTVSWTNQYCRKGSMFIVGTGSTTVFEPNDEIKGDLARTYFYMATRYGQENLSSWGKSGSTMLSYSPNTFYNAWALEMLIKWHEQDPVDEKERKRNEANYSIQGNRNPFIDYPELVDYIWGNKNSVKFYYKNTSTGKALY